VQLNALLHVGLKTHQIDIAVEVVIKLLVNYCPQQTREISEKNNEEQQLKHNFTKSPLVKFCFVLRLQIVSKLYVRSSQLVTKFSK